ncbi:putative reverse transcriptase domain-containing protein [Tanacetum coccineum]
MAPKRTTRATPATKTTTTTSVTMPSSRIDDKKSRSSCGIEEKGTVRDRLQSTVFQETSIDVFQDLFLRVDKIERYVGGLPDMIYESVMASKPKTMQDAIEMATELMDKKIITLAERLAENKRKFDDTSKNNQNQQQQQKNRQNTVKAYTVGSGERKPYRGSKPLCPKCNYHHDGPCAPKCHKCNRVVHLARDCKSPANANTMNNQRGTRAGQKPTCYECRVHGHFKRECLKLKNNNRGNPVGSGNAPAKVYAVGNAGTNPN